MTPQTLLSGTRLAQGSPTEDDEEEEDDDVVVVEDDKTGGKKIGGNMSTGKGRTGNLRGRPSAAATVKKDIAGMNADISALSSACQVCHIPCRCPYFASCCCAAGRSAPGVPRRAPAAAISVVANVAAAPLASVALGDPVAFDFALAMYSLARWCLPNVFNAGPD